MTPLGQIDEKSPTKTLIDLLQSQDAIPKEDRDRAFIILTYRFNEAVLRKCEIICHKRGYNASTAEVIAFRTFDAFARKSAFDESKGKGKNYDESVLLYLLKIAERELINYYREIERKKKNPYCGTEQIYITLPVRDLNDISPELQIELNVINLLSVAHRTIYLTYKVHQRPGFKMPRALLAALRDQLGGISQNTVNAYLKDARDNVNNAINAFRVTPNIKENGK
jgi:hypothetical protein